jgi:muramoyltetrapeptide carboxypeptidase
MNRDEKFTIYHLALNKKMPKNSLICPPALQKGDTVAIIALASKVDLFDIQPAIRVLENDWGLKVIIGESVNSTYFNFAGTDEIRQQDFQQNLDSQGVKAVFSARGGYGSARIIDKIDFTKFKKNPKWIIGFSDITEVLNKIQSLGFQALHAPMPKTFAKDSVSLNTLEALLFGKNLDYKIPPNPINRVGEGRGLITGGNLCLLASGIGTPSEVATDDKILFIEDISEYFYTVDRMMVQIKRAGKLKNLAGLIVGTFSSMKENNEPFGKTVYEIVAEHVAEYDFPVSYGFPVGHESMNWAIPCGRMATLSIDSPKGRINNQEVRLNFEHEFA